MFREKSPTEKQESYSRLLEIIEGRGVAIERINPDILRRMQLLAETTKTVEDCERATFIAERFFAEHAAEHPESPFDENEKRIVALGSLFSDIGKTGPAQASEEEQQLIVEMYAVEDPTFRAIPSLTISEFLRKFFPTDAEKRIQIFRNMPLDPRTRHAMKAAHEIYDPEKMTMRQFYDLHSFWTLEIITDDGVPAEAVGAAATHHLLDLAGKAGRVQLDDIVDSKNTFVIEFDGNKAFDRAEKLVTLLDKYDAFRRRSHMEHAEAIVQIDKIITESPRFAHDAEFRALLAELDKVGDISFRDFKTGNEK